MVSRGRCLVARKVKAPELAKQIWAVSRVSSEEECFLQFCTRAAKVTLTALEVAFDRTCPIVSGIA